MTIQNPHSIEPRTITEAAPTNAALPSWIEVKVTLAYPITLPDGGKLENIVLREPKAGALEAIEDLNLEPGKSPTVKQLNCIFAALSGLPIEVIREVHKSDFRQLVETSIPLLEGEDGRRS